MKQQLPVYFVVRENLFRGTGGGWTHDRAAAFSSLARGDAETEAEIAGAAVSSETHTIEFLFHADAEPERWNTSQPDKALNNAEGIMVNGTDFWVKRALPSGLTGSEDKRGVLGARFRWHTINTVFIY